MADPTNRHDEAALAVAARHALHDEELIAAFADGGLEVAEVDRARALVQRCVACRDLHADLTAIASAHRATVSMTITAPRDFRLPREDTPGVGPRALRGTLLERVRAALVAAGRPLGGTLVAAGLVGVLIGSASLVGTPAGGLSLPTWLENDGAAAPGATRELGVRPGDYALQPTAEGKDLRATTQGDDATPSLGPTILAGSAGLVVLGLLLLLATRRQRAGPARRA